MKNSPESSSLTIVHHLINRRDNAGADISLQFKENGRWVRYTWQEYYHLVESMAAALSGYGVERGDRVAIMSDTRPEWVLSDLAIMGLGAVTVPIYPNNFDEDVEYIINNAQIKVLILEDKAQLEKWGRISSRCLSVKEVIVFENKGEAANKTLSWSEALRHGREKIKDAPRFYVDRAKDLAPADVATILYTSGTTGRPKGVVLTHQQIMSELDDVFSIINITAEDVSLSFLPYSHIFGRVEAWANIYSGFLLAFAESIDKIRANMLEVQPTFLMAVPRIFEKIYAAILSQVASHRLKREIFDHALAIGRKVSEKRQKNESLGLALTAQYILAHKLVFNTILQSMGGRMRFAISGGAPLSADISKFFHGLGLLICEGYGLTETTAGITFNTPYFYKFGTVGRPIGDVELKFAADGEILVKSKKVMREYYNDREATESAFENGYFKTGDIGFLDEDNCLHITDRKKDLIKTAGGKYVAPQKLEGLLMNSPYISNVLVHGDQKKYIVALVTLNPKMVYDLATAKNLKEKDYKALVKRPEVHSVIRDAVAEANTHLASFESIKKFSILPNEFSVETGELTPSLKVKRKFCDSKFKTEIDELYS